MASCIVKSCSNTYRNCKKNGSKVQFYRLPKEESMRKKWIDLCGMTELSLKDPRVCSDHFDARDYATELVRNLNLPVLKLTAAPSLELGM